MGHARGGVSLVASPASPRGLYADPTARRGLWGKLPLFGSGSNRGAHCRSVGDVRQITARPLEHQAASNGPAPLAVLSTLLITSLVGSLFVLAAKNREIRRRSEDLHDQAELALRATDRLNEAQRLARQGSWEWDQARDEFLWSDGLVHLCGEAPDLTASPSERFLRLLPEGDRDAFLSATQRVLEVAGTLEFNHRLQSASGEMQVVRETMRLAQGTERSGRCLIGTVQDVTEQHQAQARLRESEEKYRRLFEMSEDPMWLIVDGLFAGANRAAARILGYPSVAELVNVHPARLSPPVQPDGRDSEEKAEDMMRIAFATGYHRFEWMHSSIDGRVFPVEVSLTKVPYLGGEALFCIWRDITAIKQTQQALEEKSTFLNGILGSSDRVAIIATDQDTRIQYYSPSAEKLFGMPAAKVLGLSLREIHHDRKVATSNDSLGLEQARAYGEHRFVMKMERADGLHYVDARVSPIYSDNQAFAGFMLMCEDVTEQRRASELIEYHASYDTLTELPNRRLFLELLHQALARARRHQHLSAALFLDLDNFKTINDSLGHTIGDAVLREVALRVRDTLREEDTVARLGGDEFVILLSELSDLRDEAISSSQALAEKIRARLAQPYTIEPHELHLSSSIGIAIFPSADETAEDILRQADTAMYQAKEAGRNAVRFFLPSMQRAAENRLRTINQLRQALPRGEFLLYIQPQFDARRQLHGAEVLLRWQHPERGLVLPGEFIGLAEEAGLILPIGNWVLHEGLRQFKAWYTSQNLRGPGRLAVNVSALQFRQADFVTRVEQSLGETGADPNWLTLEMTESVLLEDFDGTVEKMQTLKRLGVRFSIDDFGTGYSSLAYLKRLPVDEIKIDRSFVRDVMDDASDAALVDTILTMAGHIGLDVVAEGVETEAAFGFLSERGCPVFQGYHFGRPCTVEDFAGRYLSGPSLVIAR